MIVGFMLVGALDMLGGVYKTRALNTSRLAAPGLAQELLNEILAMPYMEVGADTSPIAIEAGELSTTRADFDDIDDYHNWDRLGAQAKDGTPLAGYADWRRRVTVTWANPMTGAGAASETGLKRITVIVTNPSNIDTQLVALRHKHGALEQEVSIDMTAVTWVGAELQLGGSSEITRHATHLINHTLDAPLTP